MFPVVLAPKACDNCHPLLYVLRVSIRSTILELPDLRLFRSLNCAYEVNKMSNGNYGTFYAFFSRDDIQWILCFFCFLTSRHISSSASKQGKLSTDLIITKPTGRFKLIIIRLRFNGGSRALTNHSVLHENAGKTA